MEFKFFKMTGSAAWLSGPDGYRNRAILIRNTLERLLFNMPKYTLSGRAHVERCVL